MLHYSYQVDLVKSEKYTLQSKLVIQTEELKMNKESILEMSRQENKNKDLVGANAEVKASMIAGISMVVLSSIFYVTQIVIQGTCNLGLFAVVALYNAVINIVKGVKVLNKSLIVAGVIWGLLAIGLSIAHISNIIATSTIL